MLMPYAFQIPPKNHIQAQRNISTVLI